MLTTATLACLLLAPNVSPLFGEKGEFFDPASSLPDWSHAGYRGGEALPSVRMLTTVQEYGATPDDDTDDTEAFRKAIADNAGKSLRIPAGRYVLSDRLTIEASGTKLLGDGRDLVTLYFTTSLEEIDPTASMTGHGTQTTAWSWGGGFIQIGPTGAPRAGEAVAVVEAAARGTSELSLKNNRFSAGNRVILHGRNGDGNALAAALYEVPIEAKYDDLDNVRADFIATVERVDGDRITLDRPLPFDVPANAMAVQDFRPGATDIAFGGVTIEFPSVPYRGHFNEDGYNAIAVRNVADCWLDNLAIVNADGGVFVAGHNVTIQGVAFRADRETDDRGNTGHHGMYVHGSENLVTDFDVGTRFVHDITVGSGSVLNAFTNGRGVDLAMDHHRWAPYATLWSNIDVGAATRPFASGGTQTRGLHSAAGVTFWNIRGDRPIAMPGAEFAPPRSLFIGVQGLDPKGETFGRHVESFDGEVTPPDLHAAQRERR